MYVCIKVAQTPQCQGCVCGICLCVLGGQSPLCRELLENRFFRILETFQMVVYEGEGFEEINAE